MSYMNEIRQELQGKRLMILGGSYCKDALRQFADDYGVTLIAVGNSPSAGICQIADEYYNVNSTDQNAMRKLIAETKVDGVYLGSSEPVVEAAISYVTESGFPCYCTKEQWETLQNKAKLKDLFVKFDLPVVPKYRFDPEQTQAEEIDFPVVTKPVDGCGSRGFSICNNLEELKQGYLAAAENSASGQVIVEKFVDNKAMVAFFSFTDGKFVFLGAEDKYPRKIEGGVSYVAGLLAFESRFTQDFSQRYCDKLEKMFRHLGLKEGTVWIEIFCNGDRYYFNEAGYRYGGSVTIYPIDYLYGVNQVYADMYYALTGKSNLYGYPSLIMKDVPKKKHYCIYPLYAKAGTIASIDGVEELGNDSNIVKVIFNKSVGQQIAPTGDFSQNCALIHFLFDTQQELDQTIDLIHSTLRVVNTDGADQLVEPMRADLTAFLER